MSKKEEVTVGSSLQIASLSYNSYIAHIKNNKSLFFRPYEMGKNVL